MSKDNSLGYHIQMVLPKGSGRTSATKLQQRLRDRGKTVSVHDIRKELDLMLKAGLVSYSDSIHGQPERWGQPASRLEAARAKLRAPLAEGHPRRLTDGRCAWRKMSPEQRGEFLTWIQDFEVDHPVAWGVNSFVINVSDVR